MSTLAGRYMKNIVLITIDCFRADQLGVLSNRKKITPELDRIAREGALFTDAVATGCWTATSFKAIFTSTYPLMHNGYVSLVFGIPTLAEILKKNGYDTAGYPFHPWLSSRYNFDRGFSIYEDGVELEQSASKSRFSIFLNKIYKSKHLSYILNKPYRSFQYLTLFYNFYKNTGMTDPKKTREINKRAIEWIKNANKPFFIWLHYLDAHYPYIPPRSFSGGINRIKKASLNTKKQMASKLDSTYTLKKKDLNNIFKLYQGCISYADKSVGDFVDRLRDIGVFENTYIVITADHGEQFFEHGKRPHELELYEDIIRIPLIFSGPDIHSTQINSPISHIDLTPTILGLLQLEKPDTFYGIDFSSSILGKEGRIDCFTISEEGQAYPAESFYLEKGKIKLNLKCRKVAYRKPPWKYIYSETEEDELYNLEKDPKEKNNLVNMEKDVAKHFRREIMRHLEMEQKTDLEINKMKSILRKIRL